MSDVLKPEERARFEEAGERIYAGRCLHEGDLEFLVQIVDRLNAENERLTDELESIRNWHTACEEQVSYDTEQIKSLINENEILTAALAKSERRAEAAIADLTYIHSAGGYGCEVCLNHDVCKMQTIRIGKCANFDWRGLCEANDPTKEE